MQLIKVASEKAEQACDGDGDGDGDGVAVSHSMLIHVQAKIGLRKSRQKGLEMARELKDVFGKDEVFRIEKDVSVSVMVMVMVVMVMDRVAIQIEKLNKKYKAEVEKLTKAKSDSLLTS